MSDRLRELLRQRALLQEHLAWLEREISHTQAVPPVAPVKSAERAEPAPAQPGPAVASTPPAADAPAKAKPDPEAILEKYRVEPKSLQQDVRKGCMVYFALGFLVFALSVVGLYYALRTTPE